ncbi:unnamed protein product [Brachionus calyciflorus]|uniref:Protein kinase domain-containing protein n=1 Tax=Brachionus calyciflorus TaxID=104777 RepID=A0A813PUL2_9BILA|nr:unnamed protein product [Brachionus calyciflorus]
MCPIFSQLKKVFPKSNFIDYLQSKSECNPNVSKSLPKINNATNLSDNLKFFPIKFEDPNDHWQILKLIGIGAFGKIYKVKNIHNDQIAAMKVIQITKEFDLDELIIEIDILRKCNHKNIISYYESFLHEKKIYIILEYCSLGSLDRIISNLERQLKEKEIKYIAWQILEALAYLHEKVFVIHRDIKAANILVSQNGDLKLADFGVSAKNWYLEQKKTTFTGSPYWVSPEIISSQNHLFVTYNNKVDIWSLGITCIEIADKQPPNIHLGPCEAMEKIKKEGSPSLKNPQEWSIQFQNFISECLIKKPKDRPSAFTLLKHPFLENIENSIPEFVSESYSYLEADLMNNSRSESIESASSGYLTDSNSNINSLMLKKHKPLPDIPQRSYNVKQIKGAFSYFDNKSF